VEVVGVGDVVKRLFAGALVSAKHSAVGIRGLSARSDWNGLSTQPGTQQILCTHMHSALRAKVWLHIKADAHALNTHLTANACTVSGPRTMFTRLSPTDLRVP
jgi:hypothetical protein